MAQNPHIGSSLEEFLKDEGIYEDATQYAVKRILAWRVKQMGQSQGQKKLA
jgi:hypothetical protein